MKEKTLEKVNETEGVALVWNRGCPLVRGDIPLSKEQKKVGKKDKDCDKKYGRLPEGTEDENRKESTALGLFRAS